jgi:hypothetical protein
MASIGRSGTHSKGEERTGEEWRGAAGAECIASARRGVERQGAEWFFFTPNNRSNLDG